MSNDVIDRLRSYRPSDSSLHAEFGPTERLALRGRLLDEAPGGTVRFSMRPRRPLQRLAPVAASAAVLAGVVGGAVVLHGGSAGTQTLAGGHPTEFSAAALSTTADVGPGQFMDRSSHAYSVDGHGRTTGAPEQRIEDWVSPSGEVLSIRTGTPDECYLFAHSGKGSFGQPTAAFFAEMPTDPDALSNYLLRRVDGSTSKDEAVFVAVGDMLRAGDGLASPRLRAAFVDVLSRSQLIDVHQDAVDALGRPAVRVDFTDQKRRPGQLDSLYFDPVTFRLLEERGGSNGRPDVEAGPSYAYSAAPAETASTPDDLTGPAYLDVVTSEKVADRRAPVPAGCQRD